MLPNFKVLENEHLVTLSCRCLSYGYSTIINWIIKNGYMSVN